MELRHYLRLFRQHILLILITTVVGAAIGYVTTSQASLYSAVSVVYVGSRQLESDPQANYGVAGLDQIVATFALMIPSGAIAEDAITTAHVDRSVAQVVAETHTTVVANAAGTSTNLIDVTVTDPDPVVAQVLADALATSFTSKVAHYEPATTAGAGNLPSEPAYVFQDASLPTTPLPVHVSEKVALGGVLGLVVSILGVLLLDYLDVSVKTAEDLERKLDLPVLGIVPLVRETRLDRMAPALTRGGPRD
jgi:capsular polysaccharide biosynthesis protein